MPYSRKNRVHSRVIFPASGYYLHPCISGRVGIYEEDIKKSECILWDMDSGIIFVQKLGLCKAAKGV